jgi:hypothetical protein
MLAGRACPDAGGRDSGWVKGIKNKEQGTWEEMAKGIREEVSSQQPVTSNQ